MSSPLRIAFLGPLGTYSHQVTSDYFGPLPTLVPVPRISDVFTAVLSSTVQYGLVPLENSSIGPVLETMAELRSTKCAVRDLVRLKIGHALLGRRWTGEGQRRVERVYSHEQGIGQCVRYLEERYPGVEVRRCTSTARAAQLAKEDENALAICSLKCAEVYGLEVVDTDIQDGGEENTTRFVVISLPEVGLPDEYPVAPKGRP